MDNNTPKKETNQELPEAPASITLTVKTAKGFPALLTMRDVEMSKLMEKVAVIETWMESHGWTPHEKTYGRKETPKDYVEGRMCPLDGARLIKQITTAGKTMIKCENNRYNFQLKKSEGCQFVEWQDKNWGDEKFNPNNTTNNPYGI